MHLPKHLIMYQLLFRCCDIKLKKKTQHNRCTFYLPCSENLLMGWAINEITMQISITVTNATMVLLGMSEFINSRDLSILGD